jgi:hypothetical protein
MSVSMHVRIRVSLGTESVDMCAHVRACMCVHMLVYGIVCVCVCIYIYIYIYIYASACMHGMCELHVHALKYTLLLYICVLLLHVVMRVRAACMHA